MNKATEKKTIKKLTTSGKRGNVLAIPKGLMNKYNLARQGLVEIIEQEDGFLTKPVKEEK